jgi:hypothetical protein
VHVRIQHLNKGYSLCLLVYNVITSNILIVITSYLLGYPSLLAPDFE